MITTDPIADMLTRIRNASSSKHKTVDVPSSNVKLAIAKILFEEGYIKSFEEIKEENNQGIIRITLKYTEKGYRWLKENKQTRIKSLCIKRRITTSVKWIRNSFNFNI